jgi:hypothetical protein
VRVRPAEPSDLDAVAVLTARHRAELAAWSPVWWRPSVGADDIHRAWLEQLLGRGDVVSRVVEDDGRVVGCALTVPHGEQWLVDDVAFDGVGTAGGALLAAIEERPAVLCIATADMTARQLARDARLDIVATYWIAAPVAAPGATFTTSGGADLPASPPHTFAAAFEHETAVLETSDGLVVATGSLPAPPIYDPRGTVCVVDRVVGTGRGRLLAAASAAAHERGDGLIAVVCAATDRELERRLTSAGFTRTVELVAWPSWPAA